MIIKINDRMMVILLLLGKLLSCNCHIRISKHSALTKIKDKLLTITNFTPFIPSHSSSTHNSIAATIRLTSQRDNQKKPLNFIENFEGMHEVL